MKFGRVKLRQCYNFPYSFFISLIFYHYFFYIKGNSSRTKVCLGKNEEVEACVYILKLVMALEAYL